MLGSRPFLGWDPAQIQGLPLSPPAPPFTLLGARLCKYRCEPARHTPDSWSSRPAREAEKGAGSKDKSLTGKQRGPRGLHAGERAPGRGPLNAESLLPHGDTELLATSQRSAEMTDWRALQDCSDTQARAARCLLSQTGRKAGRRRQIHFTEFALFSPFTCHFLLLSQGLVTSRAPEAWDPVCFPSPPSHPSQHSPDLAVVSSHTGTQRGRVTCSRSHRASECGQGWGPGLLSPSPRPFHCQNAVIWRPCLQPGLPQRMRGP